MIYHGKSKPQGPEETTYIKQGVGLHIDMITDECSVNWGDGERLLSVDFVLKCSCAANSAGRLST